ncbi:MULTISPECIES: VOC family protein [Actinomadura]|uniref:VOC family protein n=1 Tax=Actinomadura litoris TaxID=2678616 RepID=A0A7K1KV16_9ACTN|nr:MULTISPECIES: VOC family protein [Actinomadura]MBT2211062.1 VOC family protein [Actinomadura sp. NEAU-AAG7]MUN35983.1 VOC family protein [Actinomadura litoris]
MAVPAFNTVTWFQVGTHAPEDARRFYGDLFGWRFAIDPDEDGYDLISYPGDDAPKGGIFHHADAADNHAMFLVLVEDVDATCVSTELAGGKVAEPPVTTVSGLRFAYLEDPSGNRFGVFRPAP